MREFQERRVWRRIIFSKFSFILLAAILIFLGYSSAKIYLKTRDVREANKIVGKEADDLKAKKAELEALINRLETAGGMEEEIRDKFPVQKAGEKTVVIIDEAEKKNNLPENGSLSSFFQKIWQFFENLF